MWLVVVDSVDFGLGAKLGEFEIHAAARTPLLAYFRQEFRWGESLVHIQKKATALVAALTATVLGLSGCGTGTSAPATTSTSTTAAAAPSTSAVESTSPSASSSAATGSADKVSVKKTITDKDLAFTVDVLSYIDTASIDGYTPPDGQRTVLVEYTLNGSTKYYGVPQPLSFFLKGESYNFPCTSVADKQLTKAGYTMLTTAGSPKTGKSETGWLAYNVPTDVTELIVLYKRLAVTAGGKSIKATTMEVPLS